MCKNCGTIQVVDNRRSCFSSSVSSSPSPAAPFFLLPRILPRSQLTSFTGLQSLFESHVGEVAVAPMLNSTNSSSNNMRPSLCCSCPPADEQHEDVALTSKSNTIASFTFLDFDHPDDEFEINDKEQSPTTALSSSPQQAPPLLPPVLFVKITVPVDATINSASAFCLTNQELDTLVDHQFDSLVKISSFNYKVSGFAFLKQVENDDDQNNDDGGKTKKNKNKNWCLELVSTNKERVRIVEEVEDILGENCGNNNTILMRLEAF